MTSKQLEEKIKEHYRHVFEFKAGLDMDLELEEIESELQAYKEAIRREILEEVEYQKLCKHRDILADALSEIMATHQGNSKQPIQKILDGCIAEVAELKSQTET